MLSVYCTVYSVQSCMSVIVNQFIIILQKYYYEQLENYKNCSNLYSKLTKKCIKSEYNYAIEDATICKSMNSYFI